MSSLVQAQCQVWLAQTNLAFQDCIVVLAAPIVPAEVFEPPSEATLEKSGKATEMMHSVRQAVPKAWPAMGHDTTVHGHAAGSGRAGRHFILAGVGMETRPLHDPPEAKAIADGREPPCFTSQHPIHCCQCTWCPWNLDTGSSSNQASRFLRCYPYESFSAEVSTLLGKKAILLLSSEAVGQGFDPFHCSRKMGASGHSFWNDLPVIPLAVHGM